MSGIWHRWAACACLALAGMPGRAAAQTEYFNLDSNRPLRVEDAIPTERRALDLQLAPLRLETYSAGARRWRVDPKLSYGIAALTEIEVRLAVVLIDPGSIPAPSVIGLTSVGIGATRVLTTEAAGVPGMAIGGEVLVPAGSLAPPNASYAAKLLVTKTTPLVRVNVNASYGTYSVVATQTIPPSCRLQPPGSPGCGGQPTVPDVPCALVPAGGADLAVSRMVGSGIEAATRFASSCLTAATSAPATAPTWGRRWFAGASIDHAFALSSTLVGADLFAEHLVGLYPRIDWTAELGVRRQWSPQLVIDAGIGRRFSSNLPATTATVGATFILAAGRR